MPLHQASFTHLCPSCCPCREGEGVHLEESYLCSNLISLLQDHAYVPFLNYCRTHLFVTGVKPRFTQITWRSTAFRPPCEWSPSPHPPPARFYLLAEVATVHTQVFCSDAGHRFLGECKCFLANKKAVIMG